MKLDEILRQRKVPLIADILGDLDDAGEFIYSKLPMFKGYVKSVNAKSGVITLVDGNWTTLDEDDDNVLELVETKHEWELRVREGEKWSI